MVDPLAEVSDVRDVIATKLDKGDINSWISDAAEENDEVNDTEEMSDSLRKRIEKFYAAYLIRSIRDREAEKGRRNSVTIDYETASVEGLRRQVQSLDPSGELIPEEQDQGEPGVTRRTTRVGSTRLHSADGIGDESNGVEGAGEPN